MTFGERLYELRNKKNLSQEELAEVLDVSRQSIPKWENDKACRRFIAHVQDLSVLLGTSFRIST